MILVVLPVIAAVGLASYLAHPLCWPIGPVAYVVRLVATARQESDGSLIVAGDNGVSVGLYQFGEGTWRALGFADPDSRTNPATATWATGAYIQGALVEDLRWAVLYLPIFGFVAERMLWTSGVGAIAEEGGILPFFRTGFARVKLEARSWPTYAIATVIALPLTFLVAGVIAAGVIGSRKRGAKHELRPGA